MICRLCIQHTYSFLNIFDGNGLRLGIADILGRHFWFKPQPDDQTSSTAICTLCWSKVYDFHKFYVAVEHTHSLLTGDDVKKETFTELLDNEYINPDVSIKEEFVEEFTSTGIESELLNPLCELDSEKVMNYASNREATKIEGNNGCKSLDTVCEVDSEKPMNNETHENSDESDRGDNKKEVDSGSALPSGTVRKKRKIGTKLQETKKIAENKQKVEKIVQAKNVDHTEKLQDRNIGDTKKEDDEMLCQKVFSEQATLSRHMIGSHAPEEELNFHCDRCPKRFTCQKKLELHRSSHVPMNEGTFICDQCPNSRFASNVLLKIHIRIRHRQATNVCHVCAKEIRDKASFEKHVRLHFEGTKLKCTTEGCDSLLKDYRNLRKHIRRFHTHEDKPVKCETCGRECKNRSALTTHKRNVHSNIVYTCKECKKTFKRAINLREHMSQHTGEALYKCSFCTRTFNCNANMHTHKKKMHAVEWDNCRKINNGSTQQFIEQQQQKLNT